MSDYTEQRDKVEASVWAKIVAWFNKHFGASK